MRQFPTKGSHSQTNDRNGYFEISRSFMELAITIYSHILFDSPNLASNIYFVGIFKDVFIYCRILVLLSLRCPLDSVDSALVLLLRRFGKQMPGGKWNVDWRLHKHKIPGLDLP